MNDTVDLATLADALCEVRRIYDFSAGLEAAWDKPVKGGAEDELASEMSLYDRPATIGGAGHYHIPRRPSPHGTSG